MDNGDKTIVQLYKDHKGKVSDKWTRYLFEYDLLFDKFQDKPVRMLEIGVQNGGGLEIWAKYFRNGLQFIGCDIDPHCADLRFEDARIKLVIEDANTASAQNEILSYSPEFDIVIDDGSHCSSDIIKSFLRYFPNITDGGIYVVEDLHTSYWKEYEGGLFDPYSSIAFFKRLVDIINSEHWGVDRDCTDTLAGFRNQYGVNIRGEVLEHIHAIKFSNSLCAILKSSPPENKLGGRVVAGMTSSVSYDMIQLNEKYLTPPPQTSNPWSMRTRPPEEELPERERELRILNAQLAGKEQALKAQLARNTQLSIQLEEQVARANMLENSLDQIHKSKVYRFGLILRNIRLFLFPMGSRREKLLKQVYKRIGR